MRPAACGSMGRVARRNPSRERVCTFSTALLHKRLSNWEIYGGSAVLAHRLQDQDLRRFKMALTKQQLIGELKHEINSPLAAIRNALYLAAARTGDPEIKRYLLLADAEAAHISAVLRNANQIDENKQVRVIIAQADAASAA